jgi:signal peptidase I
MDKEALKKEIFDWVKSIVIAVALGLLIVNFVIQPTKVFQHSMEPTLFEGDRVLLEKISQKVNRLSRGDIIAFKSPVDSRIFIKRIIGVEGDKVVIKDEKVYVNGKELKEDYLKDGTTTGNLEENVPENKLFVMGDNRQGSQDSRAFGCINVDSVRGRALVLFYPFNKISTLNQKDPTK